MVVLTVLSSVILHLGEKIGRAHMRSRRPEHAHVRSLLDKSWQLPLGCDPIPVDLHCTGQDTCAVGCWEIPQRQGPIDAASWTPG